MIDLTVKTLDSQNHTFSLTDDITVRGFKEYIAETVNVPADSQRLIYCGRVLQDEKHLSEYDVNGKVIHLVQRAPPQSAQRGNSGGQSQGQNRSRSDQQQGQRMRYRQARTQFHGNPMYLGSFSIPAEVVDGHDWAIPQLSNTLSNTRLIVAGRMLDQANRVLDRLENPSAAAASDAAAADREEAAAATGGSAETEAQQQDQTANRTARFLQQLTGPVPMEGIFEFITAMSQSRPAFWSMRDGEGSGAEPSAPTPEATGDEGQPQPQEQQQQTPRRGGANSGTDQPGNARPAPPAEPLAPRPPQMAQLLGRVMDTEDRLRPFLVRYRELMELDPEIPGGQTASGEDIGTVEENQRIADGVAECFHFLSHANHALSDIIVDVSQQPPRNLRCRPMVIQHSAILQAGIPIQVEAHISVARNDGSNGESGEESGDATSRPPTSTTATAPTAQNPIDLTFVTDQSDLPPPTAGQQSEQQQQQQSQQQAQNQPQVDSPFGAIFNITNNMEVLMEMGPPESGGAPGGNGGNTTGTEQSQNPSGNNNNNNNNNNNAAGASGVSAGIFPWGPTPSPEVFRNLLHLVVHHMAQSAATGTTVASTTSTATATTSTATPTTCVRQRVQVGVGSGAAPNPGQSTQARSNVGTHPTTSTQTRSTARPHVFHPHAHPLGVGMGMGQNMIFDPFLPCNSHHIHRTPSATPTNTAATSSPQQTAQPSQSTTPNGAAQTQPDAPAAPAERVSTQPSARGSSLSLREEIAKLRGTSSSSGRSEATNNAESERAPTFEDLLSARGINVQWNRQAFAGSLFLRRLFMACSSIEVSEWLACLNSGNFTRDDVWSRLRPHLRTALLWIFDGPTLSQWRREEETRLPAIAEQTVRELRQYYSDAFDAEERQANVRNGRTIDLPATIQAIIQSYLRLVALYTDRSDTPGSCDDDEWGAGLIGILRDCAKELVNVLVFSLRSRQAGLESVIRYIATKATVGQHREFRDWVLGSVVDWFCDYSRRVELMPNNNIIPLLVYKDAEEVSASSGNTEVSKTPDVQPPAEPEPMETEEASGNRTVNDPLDLADGEEVPTTFRDHEQLLPEWVPIIARDGIRQRRQLQLQGGVTAFSDAYLDGLPSKRRKLVEQQKPRLLVSPTPNHPLIPASVERLVRENVLRAGVEEAEGAAAAVAADPGVRRAFGQAIRDCLDPRRLQTPDFPDARRFPNATKYFGDKDASSKQ